MSIYHQSQFDNGVRLVTHQMKERDSIALGFLVGVGGRYEDQKNKGAVHFLEHILFKGSRKYSCESIKELIEGVGGTLNAFTAEELTCFYAKIPSKYLKQTFDVLSDMVINPVIASKDVLKERSVICEEIKMYHDLPQVFVSELLDSLLWPGHPLGQNLAGTLETVSAMTSVDLKRFHELYYMPGNVVVSACGNIDHKTMETLIKSRMKAPRPGERNSFLAAVKDQKSPRIAFHNRPIEQMHLALGMLGLDEYHKDRYVLNLLSVILGGNMSSRLFVEVREKRGLAYSISAHSKSYNDTGAFTVRAGLDNRNLTEAVKLILRELKKISMSAVAESEFKRAKDYIVGQLLLGLEDTMDHMLWVGEAYLAKNKIETPQAVIREINKVTLKDILRVAKDIFHPRRFNCAVVGPISDEQKKALSDLISAGK